MDSNQPLTPAPVYVPASAAPGMFGTKVPSSVAFLVAMLLFLMPFVDIKCNGTSLQTITGVQLATGFKMKSTDNSLLNDAKTDNADTATTKTTTTETTTTTTTNNKDKKEPNLYALIAIGLGVLGLLLSFTNAKAAIGGAMITGIGSAAALIGMMLDVKKKVKLDMPATTKTGSGSDALGLDKLGDSLKITVDFTPWFYISVIAFLVAAFFCYKRMQSSKTRIQPHSSPKNQLT